MKKYIYSPSIAALLAMIAFSLCACSKKKEKSSDMIRPVNVAEVVVDSIMLHKDYPGYLNARVKADVVGEVNGRLLTKNFESGSYVTKGQVLFTIDPVKYKDAVGQAEATLASARSQHDLYSKQTQAMQKAYEQDAVSKMELLQSQASLRQAEANISSALSALNDVRTNLAKCTVRAPISGYITINDVSIGNYINGEGSPVTLATIYDNSVFDAVFSIEDNIYRSMLGGRGESNLAYHNMPLSFKTPMPHDYTADLYYVAPAVSSSTGALQLVGQVKNIDNELKDGMFVTVSLPYGVNPHAILVRDASISTDQLGKFLYLVNDSNKVVYTPVTVGPLYQDTLRVIEKGLKPGDRYVTEALLTVRNGMEVKPVLTK